jgi:ribosomal protein S18 acetylase RimI-like enzyme
MKSVSRQRDAQARVREFREGEFERLWAIDQACFDRELAYSRAELQFYMRLAGAFTLVSAAGDEIVGFLVGRAMRNHTGHIISIDVMADARRSGTGTQLLSAAEDRLRDSGCQSVTLETAVDNVGAITFYQRHGYSIMRTLRAYYSNGLDALVMNKTIAPRSGNTTV